MLILAESAGMWTDTCTQQQQHSQRPEMLHGWLQLMLHAMAEGRERCLDVKACALNAAIGCWLVAALNFAP